jgi:hypothetical protein
MMVCMPLCMADINCYGVLYDGVANACCLLDATAAGSGITKPKSLKVK